MITVTRKNNLFAFDHTHTHLVYLDGVYIGEIKRYNSTWHLHGFINLQFGINEKIPNLSTYDKLSLGIENALSRFNRGEILTIKSLLEVPEQAQQEKQSKMNYFGNSNRAQSCKNVINLKTGVVYPSLRAAGQINGIHLQLMKNAVRVTKNPAWAYYEPKKHIATSFY
jgi:hypothetical protein